MSNSLSREVETSHQFPFYNVRNITGPEDKTAGRTIYVGKAPVTSILDLPVDENVRGYLLEGRKRRKPTQVHRAIKETLYNRPEDFSVLNGGVTIVARACEVDEKKNLLVLVDASIINGAQTQGVVKEYYEENDYFNQPVLPALGDSWPPSQIYVQYELIVTHDEELIANVSIARNFQNDVKPISIVGALGYLNELEERFSSSQPGLKLQKSETDFPYEDSSTVDTARLLQVIAALVPEELWVKPGEFSKVYTYSEKTTCLKDYQTIYEVAHNGTNPAEREKFLRLYKFYLDVVGQAYSLYETWKSHEGFKGTALRSIKRDGRDIVEVPEGIVFPILASLSVFAEETTTGWQIRIPSHIDFELIQNAKTVYMDIAKSNPNVMGKSRACYSSLMQLTSVIKRYSAAQ